MDKPSEYLKLTNSDKTSPSHDYGSMYDLLFMALLFKTQNLRVLELGVSLFGEGSGHAFAKMPCVETFVGVDLMPLKSDLGGNGIFIQGEAYSQETIEKVKRHGPYNLLIDDCSHMPNDQLAFFQKYRTMCAVPSIMVCEDVHRQNVQNLLTVLDDTSIQHICVPELYGLNYSNMLIKVNYGV